MGEKGKASGRQDHPEGKKEDAYIFEPFHCLTKIYYSLKGNTSPQFSHLTDRRYGLFSLVIPEGRLRSIPEILLLKHIRIDIFVILPEKP
jgi:hypothetical protein